MKGEQIKPDGGSTAAADTDASSMLYSCRFLGHVDTEQLTASLKSRFQECCLKAQLSPSSSLSVLLWWWDHHVLRRIVRSTMIRRVPNLNVQCGSALPLASPSLHHTFNALPYTRKGITIFSLNED